MAGICPFAEQVTGVTSSTTGHLERAGFCDHVAEGWMSTMRNSEFWNNAKVSAHFAIGKDGSIAQLVNIFDTAWAQGRLGPDPSWPPYAQMKQETGSGNPNGWLISTEHEGFSGEDWTPEMLASDIKLKSWCIKECQSAGYDLLRFGIDSLAGHHMFDSVNRSGCPGPKWPRQQIFDAVQGQGEKDAPDSTLNVVEGRDGVTRFGDYLILYQNGVPIWRYGGETPGQTAKNFGGTWLYLVNAGGAARWSIEPGD